jgi:uncharacterized protein YecE (DUF72 family)
MEFGRFSDPDRADTRLPADPPETGRLLRSRGSGRAVGARPEAPAGAQLRIGAARWGVQEWVGPLYPPGTPQGEFLQQYALRFSTVELNATFYQMPQEETLRRWCDLVPPSFRFCPKLPRTVSRRSRLTEELGTTEVFSRRIRTLGERLGLCFLQLPPNFGPAGVTELRQYLLGVPPELPLAVELRHPGWFRDPLARETFAFLSSRGIGTVITDTLGRRDAVHMRLTTPQAFVRFVGNDLHRSDYTRIEEWAARLEQWVGQGLEELYFFVHEPKETHTLTLAAYLEEKLRERSLAPVATT